MAKTPPRQPERRDGAEGAWVALFAVLVVGGLVTALVLSRGNDGPPIPTYSPEPTDTPSPTPAGPSAADNGENLPEDAFADKAQPRPSASPTVDERKATFGAVHGMVRFGRGLLLATEDGLWALGADGPRRVDAPRHRFSALLRRADGTLLASGLSSDGKALGVVASADGGRTWRTAALDGQAAFKRLAEQDGAIYGWEASTGALMRTSDLRAWTELSVEKRLLDFAVNPADPARMVRAVPEGGVGLPEVQESKDGGKTWKRIAAPSMNLFDWPSAATLWALTEDGTVFTSTDQGYSWSPRGILPAPPTAFETAGDVLYAAVREVGVYRSGDGGKTWTRIDM